MPPSSADAYNALQEFAKNQKNSTDILTEAQDKYGTNKLRENVNNLNTQANSIKSQLDAVDSGVSARTAGSLVSEAQRRMLVGRERSPYMSQYNDAISNLNEAQNQLGGAESRAGTLANMSIADRQNKYRMLQDAYEMSRAAEEKAAKEAALAQEKAAKEAAAAEEKRRWEMEYEMSKQKLASALAESKNAGGYNMRSLAMPANNVNSPARQAPTPQQQNDYNFVKGLVAAANSGKDDTIGATLRGILNAARAGNERSKAVMREYYSMQGIAIPKNFQSFLGA